MPWKRGRRRKGKKAGHPERRKREAIRRTLIARSGGVCEYCGDCINLIHEDPKQATIDHVTPRSAGGLDRLDNLRLACRECNARKNGGTVADLMTELEELEG